MAHVASAQVAPLESAATCSMPMKASEGFSIERSCSEPQHVGACADGWQWRPPYRDPTLTGLSDNLGSRVTRAVWLTTLPAAPQVGAEGGTVVGVSTE
jgi:hypothetical protein